MNKPTNEATFCPLSDASRYLSWGRYPRVKQIVRKISWRDEAGIELSNNTNLSFLPQGLARSYGDSCLNENNIILSTSGLNRILSFDSKNGIIRCEAGACLDDILSVIVPKGWFLPVSPGTQFVTIGGAIANDIHGKNHHCSGTFGRHVLRFSLLRSDGQKVDCNKDTNAELFCATIGGLGLTGLILEAEVKLTKISSAYMDVQEIKFHSLDEFFELSSESNEFYDYHVAWIDCLSSGRNFARGIFIRGNHLSRENSYPKKHKPIGLKEGSIQPIVPFDFPTWVLNKRTMSIFNSLYFHKAVQKHRRFVSHYQPFFYPLDNVRNWNRIYGNAGFFQFQCVLPRLRSGAGSSLKDPMLNLLRMVVKSGQGSFLAVLKEFGSIKSPGLLSFPREGTTLCLDFPNRGPATIKLFQELEGLVVDSGGAIYPAKDALMSGRAFKKFFPNLEQFSRCMDPRFSSSFWRRVGVG